VLHKSTQQVSEFKYLSNL